MRQQRRHRHLPQQLPRDAAEGPFAHPRVAVAADHDQVGAEIGGTREKAIADVAAARMVAKRTMRIVRQNLAWAGAYNAVCVPLALVGWLPPWVAGLGMATSSLVVVANAMRVDRPRRDSRPH